MTNRAKKIIVIAAAALTLCVLFVVGVMVGAAVIGWKAAVRSGNEAATVQNLKTIGAMEVQYFNTHKRTFGSFEQLMKENMLNSKLAGSPPLSDGYAFDLRIDGSSYKLNADPIDDTYGRNHFFIDSTSPVIHVNADEPAGPNDPVQ